MPWVAWGEYSLGWGSSRAAGIRVGAEHPPYVDDNRVGAEHPPYMNGMTASAWVHSTHPT
jgi:hypothetical protein